MKAKVVSVREPQGFGLICYECGCFARLSNRPAVAHFMGVTGCCNEHTLDGTDVPYAWATEDDRLRARDQG